MGEYLCITTSVEGLINFLKNMYIVIEMFCILIMEVVHDYSFVKTHRNIHYKGWLLL